jgi:hypothetical protein
VLPRLRRRRELADVELPNEDHAMTSRSVRVGFLVSMVAVGCSAKAPPRQTGGAGRDGGAAGVEGAAGTGTSGTMGSCSPGTDGVTLTCVGGIITQITPCSSGPSVIGMCPHGCNRPGDFGLINDPEASFCNPPPDAASDSQGTADTTGSNGAAGTTGQTDAGAAGTGAGGATEQVGDGGAFVMCDDHADFNGRGLCSPTAKYGAITVTENLTAGASVTTLTAVFGASHVTSDVGCLQEPVGAACTAFICPRGGGANPAGPEAGAITVTSNAGQLVTKPGGNGVYSVVQTSHALWTLPKASLKLAAAGGAIPAFGDMFCGTSPVTIAKPVGVPGAMTIDRTADLPVTWTGGGGGDLEIVLRDDTTSAASSVEVRCFFTASTGQGTVPKAALAKIGAGAHTLASYLWMRKIGGAGGTCVELTGVTTNASSAGATAPFNGNATYQ